MKKALIIINVSKDESMTLAQEIAAYLGIRVEVAHKACRCIVVLEAEGDRAAAIKTDLIACAQDGDLYQIISGGAVEHLVDAGTTLAIHMDLTRIVETHLP